MPFLLPCCIILTRTLLFYSAFSALMKKNLTAFAKLSDCLVLGQEASLFKVVRQRPTHVTTEASGILDYDFELV